MRRIDWLAGVLALVAGVVAAGMAGCVIGSGENDCGSYPDSKNCHLGSGGGTSSTSTTSSITSSTSSMMDPCMGDPLTDATIVNDTCGVFVSSSATAGGKGTKASPLTTISAGFVAAKTGKKPYLFVCDEAYTETDTVKINAPIQIIGLWTGCEMGGTMWTVGTKHAALTGPADKVALSLESGATGEIDVNSLDVTSPNSATPGGSSIAVYVNGGTANMTNGIITAGTGSDGDKGADAPSNPAASGSDGGNGANACTAATQNGAPQISNTCSNGTSTGGKGGDGNITNGGVGSPGLPGTVGGQAGAGDDGVTVGWTCAANGGNGKDGTPGGPGSDGFGASMQTSFGALSTSGFVPLPGGDGGTGNPGQGGGGGGGVRGSMAACSGAGKPGNGGASGGSGGSGGCGGQGGKGGLGGGASVGLVSDNATVTLSMVTITAAAGGKGGDGGNSQPGGAASKGGSGGTNNNVSVLQAGCDGGKGGAGGPGGLGAGGRGGHSVGIASQGTTPTFDASSVTIGAAGSGGKGGLNDFAMNHGAAGEAAKCWDFGKNAVCN